jgi:hypothetical protein
VSTLLSCADKFAAICALIPMTISHTRTSRACKEGGEKWALIPMTSHTVSFAAIVGLFCLNSRSLFLYSRSLLPDPHDISLSRTCRAYIYTYHTAPIWGGGYMQSLYIYISCSRWSIWGGGYMLLYIYIHIIQHLQQPRPLVSFLNKTKP